MASEGLNLGQISYTEGYTPYRSPQKRRRQRRQPTSESGGSSQQQIGPMFELAAGKLERPLKDRSSVGTTVVSSIAHAAALMGVFLFLSMSGQLSLPTPNQASNLVAILVAAPPPPPPPPAPAAMPASPDPAPSTARPEDALVQDLPPAPPQLDLDLNLPLAPPEEPPVLALAAAPGLNAGLGSGFGGSGSGAGFGVEGGVGWGTGASGPGAPVRVGKEIAAPQVIHRVEPTYPPDAVTARVEGTVVVEATVDEQGNVIDVRVLRSIAALDQAAINAVSQWKYSPLRVNDQAAQFVLTVNVSFRLH